MTTPKLAFNGLWNLESFRSVIDNGLLYRDSPYKLKILITGSSGFIGSAVINHLQQLQIPHVPLTSSGGAPSKRFSKDVLTYEDFFEQWDPGNLFGGEVSQLRLIHCAWRGLPDYSAEICKWNFEFSQRLFRRALELGVERIVGLGSCLEYGSLRGEVSENERPLSPSTFGQTKVELSKELEELCLGHSIDYRWARIFYAYGGGQRSTSLIPSLINSLVLSTPVEARSPEEVVDLVYLTDVARALVAMVMKEGDNGVFNVGSGLPRRVADVAAALQGIWEGEPQHQVPIAADKQRGFWADMKKMRQYVSSTTFVPLEEGLQELIRLRRETD